MTDRRTGAHVGEDLTALPPPRLPAQVEAARGRGAVVALLVVLLVGGLVGGFVGLLADVVAPGLRGIVLLNAGITGLVTVVGVAVLDAGARRRVTTALLGGLIVGADAWLAVTGVRVTGGTALVGLSAIGLLAPWWTVSVLGLGRAHARAAAPPVRGLAESWGRSQRLAITAAVVQTATGVLQLTRLVGPSERAAAVVVVVGAAASGLGMFAWWHAVLSCVRTLRAFDDPSRELRQHRFAFAVLFLLAAAQPVVAYGYLRPGVLDALTG